MVGRKKENEIGLRNFLLILFFVLTADCLIHGQVCMTFQEMEEHNLVLEQLDSLYPNAIHSDTAKGPFTGRQQGFNNTWKEFNIEWTTYLSENFASPKDLVYCFHKIYFTPDGEIDYWFFNFKKEDNIPDKIQAKYLKHIKTFSKTKIIGITSETKFSQCVSLPYSLIYED